MSVDGDVARMSIVCIGLALGTLEWFIVRRTSFNKWVVPAVYWVGAIYKLKQLNLILLNPIFYL